MNDISDIDLYPRCPYCGLFMRPVNGLEFSTFECVCGARSPLAMTGAEARARANKRYSIEDKLNEKDYQRIN